MIGEILILAAEVERGGLETILPPPAELFWGAVAFVIVYIVMAKLAFPKVNELLEERAASIQGKIAQADERFEEAEERKAEYEGRIADAKSEANRIVGEAREDAESVRREIIARAEAEAEQITERARNEIAVERDRAIRQVRGEVSRLSVQLAEKIVQRELDATAHEDLIDSYIEQLTGANGETPAGQGSTS